MSCLDATSVLCAESMSELSTNTISVPCLLQNMRGFLHWQFWGFAKAPFRCLVRDLCLWFVRILFSCFLQAVFRYFEQELFRVTYNISTLCSWQIICCFAVILRGFTLKISCGLLMTEYPVLSPCTIQMLVQGITPALCPHILLVLYLWQGARCFPQLLLWGLAKTLLPSLVRA